MAGFTTTRLHCLCYRREVTQQSAWPNECGSVKWRRPYFHRHTAIHIHSAWPDIHGDLPKPLAQPFIVLYHSHDSRV